MNLEQVLSTYTGRDVEVFLAEDFLTGTLNSVGDGFIVVNTSQGYAPSQTTVFLNQVQYIRVLARV